MKKYILILLFVGTSYSLFSQQTPADLQSQSIVIYNAHIHIGNGDIIKNGSIGFKNGIIDYVGSKADMDNYQEIINANGKHVYPGFIATNSTLGLAEVDAVRATRDEDEIGDFLPHIRAAIAYDAESKIVESMRPNGVLIAQVTPRGGTISGSSSIMQLDAWNWEDALIENDEGIHLNWPNPYSRGRWWLGEDPTLKVNKNYSTSVKKVSTFFENAQVYNKNQIPVHLPYQAMSGVFEGNTTLYLHAKDEKQIVDGISYLKKIGLSKIVLVGGNGAVDQLDFLKENNIPVIVSRPHRLPDNEDDV